MKDILYNDIRAWKHKYFVANKSSRKNDLKQSATKDPGCYILKNIAKTFQVQSVNPFEKFKGHYVFFVMYFGIVGNCL